MKLILKPNQNSLYVTNVGTPREEAHYDMVDLCEEGRAVASVWGSLHIDTFNTARDDPEFHEAVYKKLLVGQEVTVELKAVEA